MAGTMQFDLVSPERRLASVQATEVQIPGADGDLTAMPDHAPLITTLRPGILKVVTAQGSDSYLVTGGFAEINSTATSVLAERAMPVGEVTQAVFDELLAEADEARKKAPADAVDAAAKLLADMVGVGTTLGLSPRA
jgi:F-type H+-transporting ATPase subunit epsilon